MAPCPRMLGSAYSAHVIGFVDAVIFVVSFPGLVGAVFPFAATLRDIITSIRFHVK